MIEAVLCDIDGTLVQSNWLHASAWKDAFAQIDIDVSVEDVRRQIGKAATSSYRSSFLGGSVKQSNSH